MRRVQSCCLTYAMTIAAATFAAMSAPLLAEDAASPPKSDAPRLKIGEPAPPFWALLSNGDATSLDDCQKRVVLVEFWSIKDKDRPTAHQGLTALRKEFLRDPRFLIVSVCIDGDLEHWIQYCADQEDLELPANASCKFYSDAYWWPVILQLNPEETQQLLSDYELKETPGYFLLQPGGRLAAAKLPPDRLQAAIAEQLEKKR